MIPREWCTDDGKCHEQTSKLTTLSNMQHLYKENVLHTNLEIDPKLKDVFGYLGIVGPGEIMYMPAGLLHQVENMEHEMALTVKMLDRVSASYVSDLLVKKQLPYCQHGPEECETAREQRMVRVLPQQIRNYVTHNDEGVVLHSADAFCRRYEGCELIGSGVRPNCPIVW